MRRSTVALGALLILSAAFNVLLLSRGRPEPSPPSAERPRAAREVGATSPAADDERRKVEILEARIRELETDKRILAEPGPSVDRLASLREKFRRIALMMDAGNADYGDPAVQVDFAEANLEISRATLGRSKDPKAYADLLRMLYELALEQPPLPEGQKALVARAFDEFSASISSLPTDNVGERMLKEIELEAAAIERVRQAIGPDRSEKLSEASVLTLTDPQTVYVTEKTREQDVVDTWARLYGLDDAQKETSRAVARAFNIEVDRVGGKPAQGIFPGAGSPEAYKLRHDVLQAQLAALRQLEGGWTPAQRERFRTQPPREFLILAGSSVVQEEEK